MRDLLISSLFHNDLMDLIIYFGINERDLLSRLRPQNLNLTILNLPQNISKPNRLSSKFKKAESAKRTFPRKYIQETKHRWQNQHSFKSLQKSPNS